LFEAPRRFRATACPGLIRGIPLRIKKTRQDNNLKPGSDSIGTEKALPSAYTQLLCDDGQNKMTAEGKRLDR
jgi:hypothetical protein